MKPSADALPPCEQMRAPHECVSLLKFATAKQDTAVKTSGVLVGPVDSILTLGNPYAAFAESVELPSIEHLVRTSAFLELYPDLRRGDRAEEVAMTEFGFYAYQTYALEVVGLQILGSLLVGCPDLPSVHHLAKQAVDEARHVEAYGRIVERLAKQVSMPNTLGALKHNLVNNGGTFLEMLVNSYVILESLAVGIFSARNRLFQGSALARLDRQILAEEV